MNQEEDEGIETDWWGQGHASSLAFSRLQYKLMLNPKRNLISTANDFREMAIWKRIVEAELDVQDAMAEAIKAEEEEQAARLLQEQEQKK
jgi:hypothetical protein